MRKMTSRVISAMLALTLLFTVGVNASAVDDNAVSPLYSEYIMAYYAAMNSDSSGNLSVYVDLRATGVMSRIGAERIKIYEKNGNYYSCVRIFDSTNYPNMITASNRYMKNAVTYKGTPGKSYYAIITLVAENSTGGDTRTYTTPIITAG